jgi:hypothetical protein
MMERVRATAPPRARRLPSGDASPGGWSRFLAVTAVAILVGAGFSTAPRRPASEWGRSCSTSREPAPFSSTPRSTLGSSSLNRIRRRTGTCASCGDQGSQVETPIIR